MQRDFAHPTLLDGERDRRIVEADDEIATFGIEPGPRDRGADVGLVLVIGNDDLDRLPSTMEPASSTAMRAAIAEPRPPRSA